MNILILEDSKKRAREFANNLGGFRAFAVIVAMAQSCISMLENIDVDVLFLDHDLGGTPSDENSGYAVACWLEQHPERKPSVIVIHSMNPIGAARMKMALPEAIYAPCIWTNESELIHILTRNQKIS